MSCRYNLLERDAEGHAYAMLESAHFDGEFTMPGDYQITAPCCGSFVKEGRKFLYFIDVTSDRVGFLPLVLSFLKSHSKKQLLDLSTYLGAEMSRFLSYLQEKGFGKPYLHIYLFSGKRALHIVPKMGNPYAGYLTEMDGGPSALVDSLAVVKSRRIGASIPERLEKTLQIYTGMNDENLLYPLYLLDAKDMAIRSKKGPDAPWENIA